MQSFYKELSAATKEFQLHVIDGDSAAVASKSEKLLSNTLVEFIKCAGNRPLAAKEKRLLQSICTLDSPKSFLLRSLSQAVLTELITTPFPDYELRHFMLRNVVHLKTKKGKINALVYLLDNSLDECIRQDALKMLARLKWKRASEYAVVLWNSAEIVDRLVALKVLSDLDVPEIDDYIEAAIASNDISVYGQTLKKLREDNHSCAKCCKF